MRFLALAVAAFLLIGPNLIGSRAAIAQSPTAQSPTTQSPTKTIGRPQPPQIVPSMIVLNAQQARLAGGKLTLQGVSPNAIVFADRPIRAAGHAMLAHLLEEWSSAAPDSFAKDPPNATVSAVNKATGKVADIVVVLKAPKLEGDALAFEVQVLEGDLAGADGAATVFIDIVGLPAAHRTARRSAWYAGAQ